MNKLKAAYRDQKKHARNRKIEFLLTYEEWLHIWETSGKLAERGVTSEKYCMARKGDAGPYIIGNVEIKTIAENISEAWLGKKRKFRPKSADHSAKIGNALRGKTKSLQHVHNMTVARWGFKNGT